MCSHEFMTFQAKLYFIFFPDKCFQLHFEVSNKKTFNNCHWTLS